MLTQLRKTSSYLKIGLVRIGRSPDHVLDGPFLWDGPAAELCVLSHDVEHHLRGREAVQVWKDVGKEKWHTFESASESVSERARQ